MKFYIQGYRGEGARAMMKDLRNIKDVVLWDEPLDRHIRESRLFRFCNTTRLGEGNRLLRSLWDGKYRCMNESYDPREDKVFLFFSSGFHDAFSERLLKKLKAMENTELVLYIVDPMDSRFSVRLPHLLKYFDRVYSLDEEDCKTHGFTWYPLPYSKEELPEADRHVRLMYVGNSSTRDEMILHLADYLRERKIPYDFYIRSMEKNSRKDGLVFSDKRLKYGDNLKRIAGADCILEVLHEGFGNATQRYTEAVCYDRRLLTTNLQASSLPFFNDRDVRIFGEEDLVGDELADWLVSGEKASYGYDGSFSPLRFIERITEDLNRDQERTSL